MIKVLKSWSKWVTAEEMRLKFAGFSCVVRPVVAFENLMLLQIRVAENFDLDISAVTNFFFSDEFRAQLRLGGNTLNISSHFKLQ